MSADTRWAKSSHSFANGNCVEVAAWCTSTHSAYHHGSCVEAGACHHGVAVRDSRDPDGPVLVWDGSTWGALLDRIQRGENPA